MSLKTDTVSRFSFRHKKRKGLWQLKEIKKPHTSWKDLNHRTKPQNVLKTIRRVSVIKRLKKMAFFSIMDSFCWCMNYRSFWWCIVDCQSSFYRWKAFDDNCHCHCKNHVKKWCHNWCNTRKVIFYRQKNQTLAALNNDIT